MEQLRTQLIKDKTYSIQNIIFHAKKVLKQIFGSIALIISQYLLFLFIEFVQISIFICQGYIRY